VAKFLGYSRIKPGETRQFEVDLARYDFVASCDIDKPVGTFCVMYKQGQTFHGLVRQFPNVAVGLQEALAWLLSCAQQFDPRYPEPPPFIIESTGPYHLLTLKTFGSQVNSVVVNPYRIKALLKAEGKDDVKDALTLAKLLLAFEMKNSNLPDQKRYELRKALRLKRKLIHTQFSNRIGSTLTENGLPLPQGVKMLSATGVQMLETIIQGETNPDQLIGLIKGLPASLSNRLREGKAGQVSFTTGLEQYLQEATSDRAQRQARKVKKIYDTLYYLPELSAYTRQTIDQLLRIALGFEQELELAEQRIETAIDNYRLILPGGEVKECRTTLELIKTAPIFNEESARSLMAEAGLEFAEIYGTAEQLCRNMGLTAGAAKSAGKVVGQSVTQGNQHYKPLIIQAVTTFLQQRQVDKGQKLLDWGRDYQRSTDAAHARIAVARKITEAAWWMCRRDEPYNDEQYRFVNESRAVWRGVKFLSNTVGDLDRLVKPQALPEQSKAELQAAAQRLNSLAGLELMRYRVLRFDPTPLAEAGLQKRVVTALNKANLITINDLRLGLLSNSLHQVKGMGEQSMQSTVEFLLERHYIEPS